MTIEVELPDGSIVEFPEGTDNATMEKALAQYRATPAKPAANSSQFAQMVKGKPSQRPPSTYNLTGIPGVSTQIGGALDAFQHRVMNPVHGAAQFVQQGLADIGLMSPDTVARDDAALRQREADFQARTAGNLGANVGGIAGDATAALTAAARLRSPGGATSALGRLAQGAAGGAAFGGAQPVLSEEDSRGRSAALHAALGAGGEGVSALFGRVAKGASDTLSPLKAELARRAQSAGIPLHVSQLADSIPLKTAASVAKYFPFSGAGKAAANQQTAFNRAVSRGFGLEADTLTDDVMQQARRNLSARFEDIYARNNVPLSPDALRRLAAVEGEVNSRLTGEEAKVVRRQMDRILSELDDAGTLTGQKYQALRSLIMKAEGPDKLGVAVKEVRQALDDIAAKAVGPEDAAVLKQLRGQWANLKTADAVLKQVAGAGGDIKPASLWAAIRKGSTKEMRELARIGQVLLKDPIPDSGTAGRVFTGGLLAGGATPAGLPGVAVALPAGAVAGRVLNSPAFGNYVVSGGGQNLQGLARLMSGAPYFLPAAAQAAQPPAGTKPPGK